MFNWQQELKETAAHYTEMYSRPGWRGQALYQLHHLDLSPVWAGLLDLVPQEVRSELERVRAKGRR